jgi:hypothetical protein
MSQIRMGRRRKHLSLIQHQQEGLVSSIEATQQLRERRLVKVSMLRTILVSVLPSSTNLMAYR